MFQLLAFFMTICCLSSFAKCSTAATETDEKKFSKNFIFGASSAAYQVEGGWNEDGKGPSIWDIYTHEHPERIADQSNADIAADSYHLFDEDLKAIKELGINSYRFSVSWSRILPLGDPSFINQLGIEYYNNIINKLLKANVQPMIAMHHFDLPQELHKLGGFTSPLFIQYFEQYADILFKNFGDRVKHWLTFNEPFYNCHFGYGNADYPPMVNSNGIADYLCMDHTIKAHATAYRLYRKKYYDEFKGKVGIGLNSRYYFSKTNNTDLINRALEFTFGILAHPIYSKIGGYPDIVVEEIAKNSATEGFGWPRLDQLDPRWIELIKGSADFLGFQYYTSRIVEEPETNLVGTSWEKDSGFNITIDPNWIRGKSKHLYSVPEGLEEILKWIRDQYENPEVIITENGWSDEGELEDNGRIQYLKGHLQSVLNAIDKGCRITGYFAWSLIDNFEWNHGYTEKFGLYAVDFNSSEKTRTQKKSARYYKNVIKTRSLIDDGKGGSAFLETNFKLTLVLVSLVLFNFWN